MRYHTTGLIKGDKIKITRVTRKVDPNKYPIKLHPVGSKLSWWGYKILNWWRRNIKGE